MAEALTVLIIALEDELRAALVALIATDERYRTEAVPTLTRGGPSARPHAVVLYLAAKFAHRNNAEFLAVDRTFSGVPLVVIDATVAAMPAEARARMRLRWLRRMPDTQRLLDAIANVAAT